MVAAGDTMTKGLARYTFHLAMVAVAVTSACRHHGGLRKQYNEIRPLMARGQWTDAAAALEASKKQTYNEKDRVMYWLNLGSLLHYAGEFERSNQQFIQAEKAIQELWTTSISAEASKVIVSETLSSYPGEDFEKVLLYLYTALNNVGLNKAQDALVEMRRADQFLKKMKVHYEKEGELGTIYRQDAFVLWLIGLFYEMEGSLNDAFLAYRAAYDAYTGEYAEQFGLTAPDYLGEDLVRSARLAGLAGDSQAFAQQTGATGETLSFLAEGKGELVVIHGNGESPFKKELRISGTMPDGEVRQVAIPEFAPVAPRVAYASVRVDQAESRCQVAEPVSTIALKNFEHRLPAIKARAVARAIVKYTATQGAKKAAEGDGSDSSRQLAGALIGLFGNIASNVSEAADLRSWMMLPANFGVIRVWLPAGEHTLDIGYHAIDGSPVGAAEQRVVKVAAGQRKILSVRSLL